MASEVLDGFDHARHEEEVVRRWGREAWERGDRWWRSLTQEQRRDLQRQQLDIAADFGRARRAGAAPDDEEVQAITGRLRAWLEVTAPGIGAERFTALARMYVDDPRFAAGYERHAPGTAELVRDAMLVHAERHLA